MLQVVVHEKGGRARRFPVVADQFTVGREADNDLVLDQVNISKHHLRLRRRDGGVEVVDLSSTNGTYVNGRKISTPRRMGRADRIYVGDYILMLEGDDPAIAPLVVSALAEGAERGVSLPPQAFFEENLDMSLQGESNVRTSARRVPPPGVESVYLNELADRVLHTVLTNIEGLSPWRRGDVRPSDQEATRALVEDVLAELQRLGQLEEGVHIDTLKARICQ